MGSGHFCRESEFFNTELCVSMCMRRLANCAEVQADTLHIKKMQLIVAREWVAWESTADWSLLTITQHETVSHRTSRCASYQLHKLKGSRCCPQSLKQAQDINRVVVCSETARHGGQIYRVINWLWWHSRVQALAVPVPTARSQPMRCTGLWHLWLLKQEELGKALKS